MKKKRIGTDPLSWINDSREGDSPPDKQGLQSKQKLKSNSGLQAGVNKVRPKVKEKVKRVITSTSQEGLKEGWTRGSFIIREHHLDKLRALAYWDRKHIKEVLEEALDFYFKDKKIKPIKRKWG